MDVDDSDWHGKHGGQGGSELRGGSQAWTLTKCRSPASVGGRWPSESKKDAPQMQAPFLGVIVA